MSIDLQRELGFLLDDFRGRVPKVAHIVALSSDGILVARDAGLEQEVGEKLAATAAGLVSLLRTTGEQLRVGDCSHNVTEYQGAYLLSMGAGPGGAIVVLAERDCDLGHVSYEATALVHRVGEALIPQARAAMAGTFTVMGRP